MSDTIYEVGIAGCSGRYPGKDLHENTLVISSESHYGSGDLPGILLTTLYTNVAGIIHSIPLQVTQHSPRESLRPYQ